MLDGKRVPVDLIFKRCVLVPRLYWLFLSGPPQARQAFIFFDQRLLLRFRAGLLKEPVCEHLGESLHSQMQAACLLSLWDALDWSLFHP